ncbi:hypothetical protein ABK040_004736 [Willaertia magna]
MSEIAKASDWCAMKLLVEGIIGLRGGIIMRKSNGRDGDVFMTSCSNGLVNSMLLEDGFNEIVKKLVKNYLKSQLFNFHDYGSSFVYLTCSIVELFNQRKSETSLFIFNYLVENILPGWIEDCFQKYLNISIDPLDFKHLETIIKTKCYTNKLLSLSSFEIDLISSICLKVYVNVILRDIQNRSFSQRDEIKYVHLHGGDAKVSDSFVKEGFIANIQFPSNLKLHFKTNQLRDLKVLIFKESLTLYDEKVQEKGTSNHGFTIQFINDTTKEESYSDFVSHWKNMGVKAVLCQKLIDKRLQFLLLKEKIACIERISQLYIDSVVNVSKATLLSSIHSTVLPSHIGYFSTVKEEWISSRSCIYFCNDKSTDYTIVLCCPFKQQCEELEELVKGILKTLKILIKHPYAVPGGGVTEVCLVEYLRERMNQFNEKGLHELFDKYKLCISFEVILKALVSLSFRITSGSSSFLLEDEYYNEFVKINSQLLEEMRLDIRKRFINEPSNNTLTILPTYKEFIYFSPGLDFKGGTTNSSIALSMIEKIVSSLLVPYLEVFVDNFDAKNLKIAVLKGVASLKDVKLKEYALDNISENIPFYIAFSYISLLEFDVPYTSLNAKSVVCTLKDVYLVVKPKMKKPFNAIEETNRQIELKKRMLEKFEKDQQEIRNKEKSNKSSDDSGFFDKLIETIVNNIKIKVENIHLSYQDDNNCCIGLNLHSLSVNSTDSNFEISFQKTLGELAYKLLQLKNLSIFLNSWSKEEEELAILVKDYNDYHTPSALNNNISSHGSFYDKQMIERIINKIEQIKTRDYLFRPLIANVKLTMQKISTHGIDLDKPQFDAQLEFINNIDMSLSQHQYISLFKIIEYFSNYPVQSKYRHLRPTAFDAKSYWNYAISCIIHQKENERKMKDLFKNVLTLQCKEYVRLYKSIIPKVPWVPKPTTKEEELFRDIENQRSIQELIYFRKCAHKEIAEEARNFEEQKKRKTSWFSSDKLPSIAIELSDKVKEELYKSIGYEEEVPLVIPDDYVKVKININIPKIAFKVCHDLGDLAELVIDRFISNIQILPQKAFKWFSSIGNFTLFDRVMNCPYPEIITRSKRSRKLMDSNLLTFFMDKRAKSDKITQTEGDIYLNVKLDQIDIVLNFEYLQRLLSFLYFNDVNIKRLEEEAKKQLKKVTKIAKREIKEALMDDDSTIDLAFDIKAPQVIVPWNASLKESKFLLIDFGHFNLSKDIQAKDQEKFDFIMDNIQILIPKDITASEYLSNTKDIVDYDSILNRSKFSVCAIKHHANHIEEKVQVFVNVPSVKFIMSRESMLGVSMLIQQIVEFKQNPTGIKEKISDLKIKGLLQVNHDDTDYEPYIVEVSATKKMFFYSPDHKYLNVIIHLNKFIKVHEDPQNSNQFFIELPQKKGYPTKFIFFKCETEKECEEWITTLRQFLYSFDTNFFVDDFTGMLFDSSLLEDEEEEEEEVAEGILIALRFKLNEFIVNFEHNRKILAAMCFSNLNACFRQYHNLDSLLDMYLHSFSVKSQSLMNGNEKKEDFYIFKSVMDKTTDDNSNVALIGEASNSDTQQNLVEISFVRSIQEDSPNFDKETQMKLKVNFKNLSCFIEPEIVHQFVDYGYDIQDVLDQITAFNKINYYAYIPEEVEKDIGQKFGDFAKKLLVKDSTQPSDQKLFTMDLHAGEFNILILNHGFKLAQLLVNSGTFVKGVVDLETLNVVGRMQNIQVLDHSEPTSLYKEILGLYDEGGSFVDVSYKYVFSNVNLDINNSPKPSGESLESDDLIEKGLINYRHYLSMLVRTIKYVHIQRFFRKVQSYVTGPLNNALTREVNRNRTSFVERRKDIISKRIIHNQIKLNIKITSPIVIFPFNFQSENHFITYLGNLEIENFLTGDIYQPIDHLQLSLDNIKLESNIGKNEKENIVADVSVKVTVKKPIITPFTKTKKNNEFDFSTENVFVNISDIHFLLTHKQYQSIFDFINGNIRDGMRDINEERKFFKSIGKLVKHRKIVETDLNRNNETIIITNVNVTAPNIILSILKYNGDPFAKVSIQQFELNNNVDINENINTTVSVQSFTATDTRKETNNAFSNFIEFTDDDKCFSLSYLNNRMKREEELNLKLSDPKVILIPELLLEFRNFFRDTKYVQNEKLDELLLVGYDALDNEQLELILQEEESDNTKKKLHIVGLFGTPQLIIPEEANNLNSRLLILKFKSEIDFTTEGIHSENGCFTISGLTVYIKQFDNTLHLVEPIKVNFNILHTLSSQQEDEREDRKKEERIIAINMVEGGNCRLSYQDLEMLVGIAHQFKKQIENVTSQPLDFSNELLEQSSSTPSEEEDEDKVDSKRSPIIANDFQQMFNDEFLPKQLVNKIIFQCKELSVLVVDDITGYDIPLVKLYLSDCNFNSMIKSFNEEKSVSAYLGFFVHGDYYNFKLAEWEPIIEKNKKPIQLLYQFQNQSPNHIIQVSCENIINFNITHSLLDTAITTGKIWMEELNKNRQKKKELAITFEPFSIVNKSGLKANFKRILIEKEDSYISLEDYKEYRFSFPNQSIDQKIMLNIEGNLIKLKVNKNNLLVYNIFQKREHKKKSIEHEICIEIKDKRKKKLIIIHSGFKVKNRTDKVWQIGLYCKNKRKEQSEAKEVTPLISLEPYQSFYIPSIYIVKDASLTLRPTSSQHHGFEYKWPDDLPKLYSLKLFRRTKLKTLLTMCKHSTVKRDHVYCIVNSKTIQPEKTILSIIPPLIIENLLNFDLNYTLFSEQQNKSTGKSAMLAKQNGSISKGDCNYVYRMNMQKNIAMQTIINNGWTTLDTKMIYVESKKDSSLLDNDFTNTDINNLDLLLHYDYTTTENAFHKVIIYSPYWVVNQTNLKLEILNLNLQKTAGHYALNNLNENNGYLLQHQCLMLNFDKSNVQHQIVIRANGKYISKPFSIHSVGTAHEIILTPINENEENLAPIHIGCFISIGKYERTKIVEITPRYRIINSVETDDPSEIEVKQFGEENLENIKKVPYNQLCDFYWTKPIIVNSNNNTESNTTAVDIPNNKEDPLMQYFAKKKNPMITIRLKNQNEFSNWSIPFAIDSIAEVPLLLNGNVFLIAKMIQHEGSICINITKTSYPPYFVVNQTEYSVTISQSYTGQSIIIPPHSKIPYIVPDIRAKHNISCTIDGKYNIGAIDIQTVKKSKSIYIPQLKKTIGINLQTYRGYTRVITIITKHQHQKKKKSITPPSIEDSSSSPIKEYLQSYIFIQGIGISIIDQQPKELCYLYLDNISLSYNATTAQRLFIELKVNRIGIDNQLDNCIFPILLSNANKLGLRDFLHFSMVIDRKEKEFDYIPYLSILVQEAKVQIDFQFIKEIWQMIQSLQGKRLNHEKQIILNKFYKQNQLPLEEKDTSALVNTLNNTTNDKMVYFELLQLHPIKICLSFVFNTVYNNNNTNNNEGYNDLSLVLQTLGAKLSMNIEEAPIRLNALILNHPPLTSRSQLLENIKAHYQRYAIQELFLILGSVDILGNPIGLFNDIDKGVYDLFYEPMEGITKSPKDFTIGLAKGTKSFFAHSLHGTFNTASKVTEALSNGISLLTMDEEYQLRRRQNNQLNKPKHVGEGLLSGAQSLSSNLLDASTGLFVKPIKGAQEEGLTGFIKGVGKGIIGIPIKPVAGLLDFMYKTSEGFKNSTQYFEREGNVNRKRWPRNFNNEDKRLVCYDENLAFGHYLFHLVFPHIIVNNDENEEIIYWKHFFTKGDEVENDQPFILMLTNKQIYLLQVYFVDSVNSESGVSISSNHMFTEMNPPKPMHLLNEKVTIVWNHLYQEIEYVYTSNGENNNEQILVLRLKKEEPQGFFSFGFSNQPNELFINLQCKKDLESAVALLQQAITSKQ